MYLPSGILVIGVQVTDVNATSQYQIEYIVNHTASNICDLQIKLENIIRINDILQVLLFHQTQHNKTWDKIDFRWYIPWVNSHDWNNRNIVK